MARSPFYPRADRTSQWFSTRTSPMLLRNKLICWHCTEMGVPGEPWPAYIYNGQRGGSAPHFTVKPDRANKRLLWRQHYRADEPARALAHPKGTPETNNAGVLQVELGGTSVKGDPGYDWPNADGWALADLADFSRWALAEWGIPLTDQGRAWHALTRNAKSNIIQAGGSSRLTWSQWGAARGHCGHEHVPGNDHVDPGSTNIRGMLKLTSGSDQGDDDMSAAEVADLKQYIRQSLAGIVDDIAAASGAAVHSQQLFRAEKPDGTPLTIGDVLLGEYREVPLSAVDVRAYVDEILARLPAAEQEDIRGQLQEIGAQVRVQLAEQGGGAAGQG